MPVEHTLKTLPNYWDAVDRGEKNFEVRRDDRGFQKGDTLVLHRLKGDLVGGMRLEYDYNGAARVIRREITYILTGGQFGVEPGYVVLGLR